MTERAFVIHVSPYLEHGALVTLLGEAGGRMTAVSRKGGMSYPEFTECEAVLREGRSMPALRELEPSEPFSELRGTRLFCGMYMNELVFRLTDDREPCDGLFYAYAEALSVIRRGGASDVAPALRGFESELLGSTGYGVDFLRLGRRSGGGGQALPLFARCRIHCVGVRPGLFRRRPDCRGRG